MAIYSLKMSICPGGEIGIRAAFRTQSQSWGASSTLAPGTIKKMKKTYVTYFKEKMDIARGCR